MPISLNKLSSWNYSIEAISLYIRYILIQAVFTPFPSNSLYFDAGPEYNAIYKANRENIVPQLWIRVGIIGPVIRGNTA